MKSVQMWPRAKSEFVSRLIPLPKLAFVLGKSEAIVKLAELIAILEAAELDKRLEVERFSRKEEQTTGKIV